MNINSNPQIGEMFKATQPKTFQKVSSLFDKGQFVSQNMYDKVIKKGRYLGKKTKKHLLDSRWCVGDSGEFSPQAKCNTVDWITWKKKVNIIMLPPG